MSEIILQSKTQKVYKSKKLNNASYGDFSHNDYQVFLYLISKIGGVDEYGKYLQPEKLHRRYVLTAKEFHETFKVQLSSCYRVLKKASKRFMKTSIIVEKPDLPGTVEINVCSSAHYNENSGSITLEFTDTIMPYLAQVQERFVLYNLKEIANFGSLYTTRLYELIQEFKDTGWFVKSIDQLRSIFVVGNKLILYADLKRKTFGHACQEINDNYEMNLSFEEIKEGRKVVAIKFIFKKTVIHKAINRKTGKQNNIYIKPETKLKIQKELNPKQLEFLELSIESSKNQLAPKDPEAMKSILSSLFSKIKSFTK